MDDRAPRQIRGTSGPVTWEVVNLRQQVSADGQETRWSYTLVLRETAGRAIQFERVQGGAYGGGIESVPGDMKFEYKLNAKSELRVNDGAVLHSRLGGAVSVFERFLGRDDAGRPITVDVRIPLAAGAGRGPSEMGGAPRPLPPAKPLRGEDLKSLAGTWHGYYRDDKGFEIPVEMVVREDGSFQTTEGDPPRNRVRGSLAVRDGQLVYSRGNETGTLTLHEMGGTRILQGSVGGKREELPSQPGTTPAISYVLRLQAVVSRSATVASPTMGSPAPGTRASAETAPGGKDLLWEVARECEERVPTIFATEIDPEGHVHFEYRSVEDEQAFMACLQDRRREKMAGRVAPRGGALRTSLPIEEVPGGIMIAVTVNGSHPARLLLDTGAGQTVLKPALLERLGLTIAAEAIRVPMTVATGETVRVPLAQIRSLEVGDFTLEGLYVGVYPVLPEMDGVDGLLGADVLGHFRASLDRRARQFTLELP
jgi:hypothetical protein